MLLAQLQEIHEAVLARLEKLELPTSAIPVWADLPTYPEDASPDLPSVAIWRISPQNRYIHPFLGSGLENRILAGTLRMAYDPDEARLWVFVPGIEDCEVWLVRLPDCYPMLNPERN
jgi:hypothetical protein